MKTYRKSHQGIEHMVDLARAYPRPLPKELEPFCYYHVDTGFVIMSVLEETKEETKGEYDEYELGIPVKYVLEKGYELKDGHVFVDAPYNDDFGLDVPDKYTEY